MHVSISVYMNNFGWLGNYGAKVSKIMHTVEGEVLLLMCLCQVMANF